MAQSTGAQVHELIQKLNAREKAHVNRMLNSNKKDSKKLRLFDQLSRIPDYEAETMQAFAAAEGIRLNSAYQGLLESIMRSLRLYHGKNNTTVQLNELLSEIQILFLKGLFELCGKKIRRGLELADRNERTSYSLLFRYWRLRQQFAVEEHHNIPEVIESQIEEIGFLIEELRITLTTHYLSHLMDYTFEDTMQPYAEARKVIEKKILQHPIIESKNEPKLSAGKYAYNDLIASGHYYLENWEECLNYTRKLEDLLTAVQDGDSKQSPSAFRIGMVLGNLMAINNHRQDHQEFLENLEEFQTLTSHLEDEREADLIRRICIPRVEIQRLKHTMSTGEVDLGVQILKEHVFPFLDSDDREEIRIRVLCEVANFYLHFERFEDCISTCNSIYTMKSLKSDRELYYAVCWMDLLACFGLREESLFSSRLRSFTNYLREGRGRDWALERTLLSALNKSIYLSRKERQELLREVYGHLHKEQKRIARPTRYFDLLAWLKQEAGH